jgi:ATP-dependent RNA helicase DeaD
MEKFRKLGIIEPILKSIHEQGFVEPTEIQEKTIPLIVEGKDVIAGAATGSGKTLAFAAGIIKDAEYGKGIQALIMTPTRELAEQISMSFNKFSKHKQLRIIAVYGGVSINPQIYNLRDAEVVVGTPGRLLDHINRRTIDLSRLKILVLDEADRMLDMGFKDDVERIIHQCPKQRQTLLFSATISQDVSRLAGRYMHHPVEVSAEAYVDPSKLTQTYYDVEDNQKFSLLVHFLKHEDSDLVMVFCNTQHNTDFVANNLRANEIDALAIHGGYSQDKRTRTMEKFHAGHVSVLVCTDVAARGLDIKGVSHIYNYDIPKDSKDYIHRIGRTARAGEEGIVINILAQRDYQYFQKVIDNPDLKIAKGKTPDVERIRIHFMDHRTRGFGDRRGFGHRESRGGYGRSEGRGYGRESRGRFSSGGQRPHPSYRSYRNEDREERRGERNFRSGEGSFKSGETGYRRTSRFGSRRNDYSRYRKRY